MVDIQGRIMGNKIDATRLARACYQLEVFSYGKPVGLLEKDGSDFVFRYHTSAESNDFVSLLMPVGAQVYRGKIAGQLPAPFDMNLPEGGLLQALTNRYGKIVPGFNPLSTLYLVGQNTIGHVTFGEPPAKLSKPKLDLEFLMDSQDTEELLLRLYEGDAVFSGIAGAQPKVLGCADEESIKKLSDPKTIKDPLRTFKADNIIVKTSSVEYPWLAANEFFSLRAAELSGLSVPDTRLFLNGQILLVSRFDRDEKSQPLGAEDFCSLNAQVSTEKYVSTYEKMAKTIRYFCSPENLQNDLREFFKSLLLTCLLHNGDAHMKNFTLLHQRQNDREEPRVWLSPVYDICTTNAYLAEDMLALTLAGSKRYPTLNKIHAFGLGSCSLSKNVMQSIIEDVAHGIREAAVEMTRYCDDHPDFHQIVGANMLKCWKAGLDSVNQPFDIHHSWFDISTQNSRNRPKGEKQ